MCEAGCILASGCCRGRTLPVLNIIFGAAAAAERYDRAQKCSQPAATQTAEMSESGSQEPAAAPNGGSRPRPPVGNRVTVVLGAQWGDEGKGKVVDLLAQDADMVCRCQVG